MQQNELEIVISALEDIKAVDTVVLPVGELTSLADYMIITSGRSTRHVKSIADHVAVAAKQQGLPVLSVEGDLTCEWVLVDLGDIIIHVMQPSVREYYQLEKLWSVTDAASCTSM